MNKNFRKKVVTGALAFSLLLGLMPKTAFAIPLPPKPEVIEDVKLPITKILNMPEAGVKTPAEDFEFVFTPHSKDGDTGKVNEVPAIDVSANKASFAETDTNDEDTATEGKQIKKVIENVLKGVSFTEAGQYTYTVTEKPGATAGMTYSKAAYKVSIFVAGVGKEDPQKMHIQAIKIKNDDGTTAPTTKVDPTAELFVFNNNYDKEGSFELNKEVVGATDTKADFIFSIKVDKPVGSHSEKTGFIYTIKKSDGTNYTQWFNSPQKYGTSFEVRLRKGEKVEFDEVLFGSKVSIDETNPQGYTPSIKADSKLNGQAVADTATLKDGMIVGDAGDNSVTFVNTEQTPTGVLIDNLPFIFLVGMAGLGLVFFIKNRKEEAFEN